MSTTEPQTWSGYLSGYRWAFTPATIEMAAIDHNLEVVEIREEKRVFTKTMFFKLRGRRSNLQKFQSSLRKAIQEWNEDI